MSKKPTYQEIKKEIFQLEKAFNFSLDLIGIGNLDGYFIKINPSFSRILGYSEEEFLSLPFLKFVYKEDFKKTEKALLAAAIGENEIFIENRYKCKDGSIKWIDWKVLAIKEEDLFIAVGRDITERKQFEKELKREKKNLEEVNAALKIILRENELRKTEIEENIFLNIEKLLLPYLTDLGSTNLSEQQQFLLEVIQQNIKEVTGSFSRYLIYKYSNLTPREIQIANLIKQGRTNKEIAKFLTISPSAVDFHRQNLRVKLNIKGKKISLRSILLSPQF
jgi:PAS domain S-box-containing protein